MRRFRGLWCAPLFLACGSAGSEPGTLAGPDAAVVPVAEPTSDAGVEPPETVHDASPDASSAPDAEAGVAVDACVPPPVSEIATTDDCAVIGSCPTCAGGVAYSCKYGQPKGYKGGAAPGCRLVGFGDRGTFCCPPVCVRRDQGNCGSRKAFVCPPGVPKPNEDFCVADDSQRPGWFCCAAAEP